MKKLCLLRHAKSDWAGEGLDDFDRPLAARGIKAAPVMGRYLKSNNLDPDLVFCSSALRTRQTWNLVAPELGAPPDVRFLKSLYLAPPGRMLAILRTAPSGAATVLLIGHNPGLHDLTLRLAGGGNAKDLTRLAEKYPTAALAVLDFDIADWSQTAEGAGNLKSFVRPRDLI